jgi:hypothetical protein
MLPGDREGVHQETPRLQGEGEGENAVNALTVCQPYAELICRGLKWVENRRHGRFQALRGPLLIHAGKSREWLDLDETGRRDARYDLPLSAMAFGAIVGRVHVAGAFRATYRTIRGTARQIIVPAWALRDWPWLRDHEHVEGPYCLVLTRIERLQRPFPCRGQLGIFDASIEALEQER